MQHQRHAHRAERAAGQLRARGGGGRRQARAAHVGKVHAAALEHAAIGQHAGIAAAAFGPLPTSGSVFVSVSNRDKRSMIFPVKVLADLGFEILATQGTAEVLRRNGVDCTIVRKHFEGPGPDGEPTTVQLIHDGRIQLIVNTPYGAGTGGQARLDGYEIRTAAVMANVPCITTVQGLGAAVQGIEAQQAGPAKVKSLQEHAHDVDIFDRRARA